MHEELLQTISSLGHMSLEKFYSAFDAIQLRRNQDKDVDLHEIRRRSIRFLDALGHCEFDFDKRRVFACPPVLVRLPSSGLPQAVLAGARTDLIMKKLKEFEKCNSGDVFLRIIPQIGLDYLLPSAIIVEALSFEHLQNLSQYSKIASCLDQPASWSLVNFSCGLEDIFETLSFETRDDRNWEDNKETFSYENLRFSKYESRKDPIKLVSYINRINQQRFHLFWDNNRAAEVDRDWGRYILLSKFGRRALLYDKHRHILAVPSSVPLPRLLSRAAALCSGIAPEHAYLSGRSNQGLPEGQSMDVYRSISPPIAQIIAMKLSQELINYKIVANDNGVIA
ncbi:MAG: hypothetical protein WCW68_00445 [Methanothrix sp.]